MASLGLLSSTSTPNPDTTDAFKKKWGADAILVQNGRDGAFVYLPSQDISVPINPDGSQDLGRSTDTNGFNNFMMQILPIAAMSFASAGVLGAAGAAGATEGAATGTAAGSTGAAAGSTAGLTQAELAALIESGTVGTAGAGLEAAGLGSAAAGGTLSALEAGQAQPPVDAGVGGSPNAPGSFATDPITGDVTSLGTQPGAVGTVSGGATTAGGVAAGGSALSRILSGNGTASAADWASILGTLGATGLGVYGSQQHADALRDIANQARADRAPYLSASTGWLANPDSYWQGPGKTALDANLRALSATHGNPIDSPTALGIASQAGLADWRNAVTGFGNLGLAGEDSRNSLMAGAAGAENGIYNSLGYGLSQLTNPPTTIEQLLKQMKGTNSSGLA